METKRIINLGPPTGGSDAISKWWIDQQNVLKNAAIAMLNMNNFCIFNLATPVNNVDAVTKGYVDNKAKNYQLFSGATSYTTSNVPATIAFSLIKSHEKIAGNGGNGYVWPVAGRVLKLAYNFWSITADYTTACNLYLIKNTIQVN